MKHDLKVQVTWVPLHMAVDMAGRLGSFARTEAAAKLIAALRSGRCESEGYRELTARRETLSKEDWLSLLADIDNAHLISIYPRGGVWDICINADDVTREFDCVVEMPRGNGVTSRGRKPIQMPRVLEAMKADSKKKYDLAGATEEELVAKYKASRDTCRKARNKVLSLFVGK